MNWHITLLELMLLGQFELLATLKHFVIFLYIETDQPGWFYLSAKVDLIISSLSTVSCCCVWIGTVILECGGRVVFSWHWDAEWRSFLSHSGMRVWLICNVICDKWLIYFLRFVIISIINISSSTISLTICCVLVKKLNFCF